MKPSPGISIIIATEGRVHLTAKLLKSLLTERRSFNVQTEVVVIDSSAGKERSEISRACKEYEATLVDGPSNVRKKRNLGINKASFSVLLFLDSDCNPSTNLLEKHWQHYAQYPSNRTGGVLGRLQFTGVKTFAWYLVRDTSLVQHFSSASYEKSVRWGATANLSIRREVFNDIGMFDESFPFRLGGDDLDLTYRMTYSGWELVCEPEALVFHDRDTWSSVSSVLLRAIRWGRMEFYIYRKHPSLHSPTLPTIWGWLILITLYAIFMAFLQSSIWFLAFPAIWFFISTMIFSTLIALTSNKTRIPRFKIFILSLLSSIPELTYQLGNTVEFLRHGDLRFFYSRALLNHQGIKGYWEMDALNIWSNLLSLLICLTCWT